VECTLQWLHPPVVKMESSESSSGEELNTSEILFCHHTWFSII
jgi:hypothetical protein